MSATHVRNAVVALAALCVVASGCGGGGGVASLRAGGGSAGGLATATLRILIPQQTSSSQAYRRRTGGLRPAYVSPSTTQLAYSIDGTQQTPVSLTPSNPDCTGSGASLVCTVPFEVAPGAHTFSFILQDAHGSPLSGNTNVSFTLAAGQANALSVTLGGIATSVLVQPTADANRVAGSQSSGYQIYGNAPVQFLIVLQDADGNAIVGTGAPAPSISPGLPSSAPTAPYVIATPSPGGNVWTLISSYQPTDPTVPSLTGFSVVATPVPYSGGNGQTLSVVVPLQLYQPWIYVVNNGNGTVSAYDEQGNQKSASIFGALSTPVGIAINNGGSLSTASPDPYAGTMYVTTANATSPSLFVPAGSATSAPGSFSGLASPGPAVFDANNNNLYVANTSGTALISAFSETGSAASSFTPPTFAPTTAPATAAPGWIPTALAYDSRDQYIFLASTLGSTTSLLSEYNEAGALQTSWSTALSAPSGLAYDPNSGWIYVANSGNNTITAYDKTGAQQSVSGFGGLSSPGAMLFDPYANVFYVVSGGTIKAYSESGSALTLSGAFPGLSSPSGMVLVP